MGRDANAFFVIWERDDREDPDLAAASEIKVFEGGVLNPVTPNMESSESSCKVFKSLARIFNLLRLTLGRVRISHGEEVIKPLDFSIITIPSGC
jgi:hypothetical protein